MSPPSADLPNVSEAELRLLKVLWRHPESTVRELQEMLLKLGQEWAYTTVQTILQRLEKKGYAAVDRAPTAHRFRAAVSRDGLLARRLGELREDLCEGENSPLILNLVRKSKFSSEEIAQLRRLLDSAEERN